MAAPSVPKAGREQARRLLAEYERLRAVVSEQEAALEEGVGEEYQALVRKAREIRARVAGMDGDLLRADPALAGKARAVLRELASSSERIQSRISGMRARTAEEIRAVARGREGGAHYLDAHRREPASRRLDLRL